MPPLKRHPIGTPRGTSSTQAVIAVGSWLSARGLCPPIGQPWSIELALDASVGRASLSPSAGTSFHLRVHSEEWGYTFSHDGKVSSIRVGDVPFVHDRDEHQLLASTPTLRDVGTLVRKLEQRFGIRFQRQFANVRTTLAGAEPVVLAWATSL